MDRSSTKLPLSGVKVLELGSLIAGPYAASLFAQFGAEVIKIEPPGVGDPLRKWRKLHEGTSLWWYVQSRNKKSVSLDLKCEEGRSIIRREHHAARTERGPGQRVNIHRFRMPIRGRH